MNRQKLLQIFMRVTSKLSTLNKRKKKTKTEVEYCYKLLIYLYRMLTHF